jgi:hypothetical protein
MSGESLQFVVGEYLPDEGMLGIRWKFTGKSETVLLAKASLTEVAGRGVAYGTEETGDDASCLMISVAAVSAADEWLTTGKADRDDAVNVASVVQALAHGWEELLFKLGGVDVAGDATAAFMKWGAVEEASAVDDGENGVAGDDDDEGMGEGDLSDFLLELFVVAWNMAKGPPELA